MGTVTWLHTADLHLGKPIDNWKGTQEEYFKRKDEYRKTFKRMIDIVQEQSIPYLLIAGDFLEHGYVTRSLWEFVWEQFSRIPHTSIWIAPGNHDPYRSDSIYRKETWPNHVHIFGSKWEEHTCSKQDLTIFGKGFSDFHEKDPSLPQVKTNQRSMMVVHGELMSQKKKSNYFPILEEELHLLDLHYVAMGHIHQAYSRRLSNNKQTYIRYPGSPEALSWKETNERTVTIGKFTDEGVMVDFCPIHTRVYEQHTLQLTGIRTREKLYQRLIEFLTEKDKQNYYLFRLTGCISPERDMNEELSWAHRQLAEDGYQHIYFENQALPDLDIEQLRKKSHVIAQFIDMMEEKMDKAEGLEKERFHSALYKGLEACVREISS